MPEGVLLQHVGVYMLLVVCQMMSLCMLKTCEEDKRLLKTSGAAADFAWQGENTVL